MKARGEWDNYGRPSIVADENFAKEYQKVLFGEIRPFELMKKLGISKTTYYRYVKNMKKM